MIRFFVATITLLFFVAGTAFAQTIERPVINKLPQDVIDRLKVQNIINCTPNSYGRTNRLISYHKMIGPGNILYARFDIINTVPVANAAFGPAFLVPGDPVKHSFEVFFDTVSCTKIQGRIGEFFVDNQELPGYSYGRPYGDINLIISSSNMMIAYENSRYEVKLSHIGGDVYHGVHQNSTSVKSVRVVFRILGLGG